MSQAGFEVRPVTRYAAPRYPTTVRDDEEDAPAAARVTARDVLRALVCALLVLGLVVGALACGDRGRLAVVPPRHDGGVSPDGGVGPDGGLPPDGGGDDGGDILVGDVATCTPADIYCVDSATLMECQDYVLQPVLCDDYCHQAYGPQSYSAGCDVQQADPCQCYDMLDGGMAECTPDMIQCVDAATVTTCDPATGSLVTTDCDAYCEAVVGPGAVSTGCDASRPDDPCGCVRPKRR